MNPARLARYAAVVAAVVAVLFVAGWVAGSFNQGVLAAIAIGSGVAVAIFSGGKRTCAPRFLRRRE
jgi:hypothetical protein